MKKCPSYSGKFIFRTRLMATFAIRIFFSIVLELGNFVFIFWIILLCLTLENIPYLKLKSIKNCKKKITLNMISQQSNKNFFYFFLLNSV